MKAKIEYEIKPFPVPSYIVTEMPAPDVPSASLPLDMLDVETLDRLCLDFRNAVYTKAGKIQPPTEGRAK